MNPPRMTVPTQLVLRAVLERPDERWYGLQLCELTGLNSGSLYPILMRLERLGWLRSAWEDPDDQQPVRRPARRYYELTDDGAEAAREALRAVERRRRHSSSPRPHLAGGDLA